MISPIMEKRQLNQRTLFLSVDDVPVSLFWLNIIHASANILQGIEV